MRFIAEMIFVFGSCSICFAGEWRVSTRDDFNSGSFNDTMVSETGEEAEIKLLNLKWSRKSSWDTPYVGKYANPAFTDLDNDGDYDLLIGEYYGNSYAYENTGDAINPAWSRKSSWDAPDVGSLANPAFTDLDNDGDYDLFIGECYGNSAYENTGDAINPAWSRKSSWDAPDVGQYASPAFADLDNDGDYDLLITNSAGYSYAYENIGDAINPAWSRKSSWDAPDVGSRAAPAFADLDNDGDYDLLTGEYSAYAYENTGDAINPAWLRKSSWDVPEVGSYASPTFADLDNDGDYDLLIGEYYGNSYAYENSTCPMQGAYILSKDFGSSTLWSYICWTKNCPEETEITFNTRTSDDNSNWSEWSSSYTVSSGEAIDSPSARYVQVRTNFSTTISTQTPVLKDFTIFTLNSSPKVANVNPSSDEQLAWHKTNPKFSWTFEDYDEDSQIAFQIKLRISTGTYSDVNAKDSGEISSSINTCTPTDWNLSPSYYYWKVRAKDDSGYSNAWSTWSVEMQFQITPNNTPDTPVNISPPSEEYLPYSNINPEFHWTYNDVDSDTQSAVQIQVRETGHQYGEVSNWGSGEVFLSTNSFTPETFNLSPGGTYYWHIKVKDNSGFDTAWSDWSTDTRFYIKKYNISPDAPTNISPPSDESLPYHKINPLFKWSTFSDADNQEQSAFQIKLRISTGTYNDTNTKDSSEVSSSTNAYTPSNWNLSIGTSYYWQVRVKDNSGFDNAWSTWSIETQFYIRQTNVSPVTPTNTSPPSDESLPYHEINPQFEWTEFLDADEQEQTAIQIKLRFSTGTYGDVNAKDSGEVVFSTNAYAPSDWNLSVGTSYYWQVRVKDNSGFDNAWSTWSIETQFYIRQTNVSPDKPTNIFPSSGTFLSWDKKNPEFSWSSFYDIDFETQTAIQVKLRYSTGTYEDAGSKDTGEVVSSTNTYTPSDWNLSPGNTYYWKCSVKDNSGFENAWSTWSAETVFYIQYNISPSSSANTLPLSGASLSRATTNPTFSWSEFYDVDGDTQSSFRLILRYSTGTYGNAGSKDSGEVVSSTNTYTSSDWNLSPGNAYYWKVRVKDNSGFENAWSTWSVETSFFIAYNISPSRPMNSAPANGEILSKTEINPVFRWSDFYNADGDTQTVFQVKLRYSTGTYGDSNNKDTGEVVSSTNIYTSSDWNLSLGNTYYWKCKVKDNSGFDNAWSTWSAETQFYIKNNIPPDKPTNSFPSEGQSLSRNNTNPTFSWSVFYDVDGDSQSALQVQLRYSTGSYGAVGSKDTGEVVSSTNTYTPSDWNLSPGNTYYWKCSVKDNSGFDNAWSTWSAETVFYIQYNISPSSPVNMLPLSGASLSRAITNPTFLWSTFYDVDGDTQSSFRLILRYSTRTYGDAGSKDTGEVASSTNIYTSSDWNLSLGNTYYWKCKVKDNSGFDNAWSTWSMETQFYIKNNIAPDKPTNSSPSSGAYIANSNPEFIWSEFNNVDNDLQDSLQVQLRILTGTYGDGNSKDSGEILSSTNTWTPTDWNLSSGNTYYWRVKVKDNFGFDNCWSEWSEETSFIKIPTAPTGININPPTGETHIKNNDTIIITGNAEPGTTCEIVIKDQNGRILTCGIQTSNLNVGDDGKVDAQVFLGKITENYPLATKIQVEVSLIDPAGHKSTAASSSFVVFKAEKEEVKLYDNLINPADGKPVTVRYELPAASRVTIEVYNRKGTLIKKIMDNQLMGEGIHTAEWLGKNISGNIVASGIYIIHIKTDSYSKTLKAVVVK